jgi:hypothetical protein
MKWLFRPSSLLLVMVALALSAAAVLLWQRAPSNRALPRPVIAGDQEVVWLDAATNTASWERFVTAVHAAVHRLHDHEGLALELDAGNAFPQETTTVPELSLALPGGQGRLWFRWYKQTNDLTIGDWITALLARRPAPLAIIGGSSSDEAIELARALREEASRQTVQPALPLLFLTGATSDEASDRPLTSIYPGRTFRFCFTNRQMAEAVTDFIWSRDDLWPDGDQVYSTYWMDDPFSKDLNQRFTEALLARTLRTWAQDWAWQAGVAVHGGLPLEPDSVRRCQCRMAANVSAPIFYSVGMFARPNRWELDVARDLMEWKLKPDNQMQKRPLLIVPATSQPTRRFLRALLRIAPVEARRFVVVNGDGIAFNTVYRDRDVTWSIQDLPLSLVFFCHRNPVNVDAGFVAEKSPGAAGDSNASSAGTEDVLLDVDIVECLAHAGHRSPANGPAVLPPVDAEALRERLRQVRWLKAIPRVGFADQGQLLFDEDGNRRSGTGEHVVYLQPTISGKEVLPHSTLEIWAWQPDERPGHRWTQRQILAVDYEGSAASETGE